MGASIRGSAFFQFLALGNLNNKHPLENERNGGRRTQRNRRVVGEPKAFPHHLTLASAPQSARPGHCAHSLKPGVPEASSSHRGFLVASEGLERCGQAGRSLALGPGCLIRMLVPPAQPWGLRLPSTPQGYYKDLAKTNGPVIRKEGKQMQ